MCNGVVVNFAFVGCLLNHNGDTDSTVNDERTTASKRLRHLATKYSTFDRRLQFLMQILKDILHGGEKAKHKFGSLF